jgi:hypothetical protein
MGDFIEVRVQLLSLKSTGEFEATSNASARFFCILSEEELNGITTTKQPYPAYLNSPPDVTPRPFEEAPRPDNRVGVSDVAEVRQQPKLNFDAVKADKFADEIGNQDHQMKRSFSRPTTRNGLSQDQNQKRSFSGPPKEFNEKEIFKFSLETMKIKI